MAGNGKSKGVLGLPELCCAFPFGSPEWGVGENKSGRGRKGRKKRV